MTELALRKSPVPSKGLCWPPAPSPGWGQRRVPLSQSWVMGWAVRLMSARVRAPRVSLLDALTQAGYACAPAADLHSLYTFFTLKRDKSLVRGATKRHQDLGLAHDGARAKELPPPAPAGAAPGSGPAEGPHVPRQNAVIWVSSDCYVCCSFGHGSRPARHTALPCSCGSGLGHPSAKPQEWLWMAPEMLHPQEQLDHLQGAVPAVGPNSPLQRQQHLQVTLQGQSQSPCGRCPVKGDGSLHPGWPLCPSPGHGAMERDQHSRGMDNRQSWSRGPH